MVVENISGVFFLLYKNINIQTKLFRLKLEILNFEIQRILRYIFSFNDLCMGDKSLMSESCLKDEVFDN